MRNLRVYLKELEKNNDLAVVEDKVHWDLEAAAITGKSYKKAGPAMLFKNLEGYPEGFSLAGGLFTGPGNLFLEKRKYWHRVCTAMGLPTTTSYSELLNTCMERVNHPILPLEVDAGPVKEVVKTDGDVDLSELPIPMLHRGDGGRYGTLQTMIVKDIETDWTAWQNIRTMVVDKNLMVAPISEDTPVGRIYKRYKSIGKPMPFCLSIGGPPLVTISSFMALQRGSSCAAVAGGLNLDPIELIKAETSDLLVPSESEVIIEGELSPSDTLTEGPFPEYWFYRGKKRYPAMKIKAISRRNDPIIPFSVDGIKSSDTHNLQGLMLSYELYRRMIEIRAFPINWIQMPIEFNLNVCVVCAPIIFSGYVLWLSRYALSQSRSLGSLFNKVIVVDEKAPENSLEDIINDFIQRMQPNRDFHFIDKMPIGPNARYASKEQRKKGFTSGMYMDTSWPKDWEKEDIPRRTSIEGSFPREVLEKVKANYNKIGFKEEPVVFEESIIEF